MAVKKRVLVVMIAWALLLAVGISPGLANPARALPGASAEQAGTTIPYAGRLSDDAGQPVLDGAYDLSFALYDRTTGGDPIWSETQQGVAVSNGQFLTTLGRVAPIPATALGGQTRWLAVSVRGPGEAGFTTLAPRQRVSAAAPTAGAACPHDHLGEWWTGDPGTGSNGLRVESTRTDSNGITGVAHNGANSVGVFGWTTEGVGVWGSSDNGTGVWAHSANGTGVFAHSDNGNSIYVDGAGNHALYIQSSGMAAIEIASSGGSGVLVDSASVNGVTVNSAALDGIKVYSAGDDGVHVVPSIGGVCYRCSSKEDDGFVVLNTGEVRSSVGFAAPANDFAVTMPVEDDKASYELGDVLVVSESGSGAAEHSTSAYSPAVIGVYAAAPAFVGGRSVAGDAQAGGLPVALLGVVPCKVSAENGPIRPGDLLATSATPGHAMRADDSAPRGTILGKALESLDEGTGIIQVLVTLQ